jgi:hypothetical protein
MVWNWEIIRAAIAAWPWSQIFAWTFASSFILWMLLIAQGKFLDMFDPKPPTAPKSPEIQFLEDALNEEEVRKPNPNYTYAQFKDDLYNKGLTFNEIYEKCGGVLPQKPPPEPPAPAPILPMSIHEIQGQNGEIQGQNGGADGGSMDRMAQLQQWFQQRGSERKIGNIVKPPPNPYPIIHKIYIRGRR